MANEVYTDYWFEGDIPEGFSKLKNGDGPEEVSKLFNLEFEQERWYVDYSDVDDKNHAHVNVWSAWNPMFDPWRYIADEYDLKLTWFTCNELPYYFDSNSDDCAKYVVYYDYEDPEEWYYGDNEYFMSAKRIKETVVDDWKLTDFKIITRTAPFEWYDDELLKEYTYDGIDGLNALLEDEE